MPVLATYVQAVWNAISGIIISALVVQWFNDKMLSSSDRSQAANHQREKPIKGWLLVVTASFQCLEDRDALLQHVRSIARHSAQHEQNTLGFQVAVADNDPLKILVFERFANKEAWSEAHRSSSAYKAYKAWQATSGIQVQTTGQSYDEMGFGFLTESERTWHIWDTV